MICLKGTELVVNPADNTISYAQLEQFFGENYKDFEKWMYGQTATENGVFVWDVEQYIKGNRKVED